MIQQAIIKLSKKQDLTYAEAEAVMNEIMSGETTPVQTSAYLTALSLKGRPSTRSPPPPPGCALTV